jgi:hypothetical protein
MRYLIRERIAKQRRLLITGDCDLDDLDVLLRDCADALGAEIAKREASEAQCDALANESIANAAKLMLAEARVKELEAKMEAMKVHGRLPMEVHEEMFDTARAEGVAEGLAITMEACWVVVCDRCLKIIADGKWLADPDAAERRIATRVVGAMSDDTVSELRASLLAAYGSATRPSHIRAALQRAIEEVP